MRLQPEGGVNAPNVCGRLFKNQKRTRKFQLLACNTANFHLNPIPIINHSITKTDHAPVPIPL